MIIICLIIWGIILIWLIQRFSHYLDWIIEYAKIVQNEYENVYIRMKEIIDYY